MMEMLTIMMGALLDALSMQDIFAQLLEALAPDVVIANSTDLKPATMETSSAEMGVVLPAKLKVDTSVLMVQDQCVQVR